MSDLAEAEREADPAPKRRGRPPKLAAVSVRRGRKRKDPDPAPIDGDYAPLDVVNKKPGFEYKAFSARDMQSRGHQVETERWSEDCAHSPWETFTEDKRGKPVMINGQLTLVKAPANGIFEARRKRELAAFRAASKGISVDAEAMGHRVRESVLTTHTITVPRH